MTVNFCIGLDLGSDTMKIAYAYTADGAERSGKISCGDTSLTAIPAVAYFDAENDKWYFGEQVDKAAEESFITVVKIKRLLSLLSGAGGAGNLHQSLIACGDFFYHLVFLFVLGKRALGKLIDGGGAVPVFDVPFGIV